MIDVLPVAAVMLTALSVVMYATGLSERGRVARLVSWVVSFGAVLVQVGHPGLISISSGAIPLADAAVASAVAGCAVFITGLVLGAGHRGIGISLQIVATLLLGASMLVGSVDPVHVAQAAHPMFVPFAAVVMAAGISLVVSVVASAAVIAGSGPAVVALQIKAARLGLGLLILAVVIGALLARSTTGLWWSWDPGECLLLATVFLYAGWIHACRSGILGRKTAAVLNLVAFVLVAIFWFLVGPGTL